MCGRKKPLELISHASGGPAANSATLTINKPTGAEPGDLLLAVVRVGSSGATWTGPSGWTEHLDAAGSIGIAIFSKVVTGSEGGSFNFTTSAAGTRPWGQIILIRGGALFDVVGSVASGSGDGTLTATGITASGGMLVVAAIGISNASRDFSVPAGMQAVAPVFYNNTGSIRLFYQKIGSGATGNRITTASGGSGNTFTIQIAIKRD